MRRVTLYTTRVDAWCRRECQARGIVYLDVTRKSGETYTPESLQAAGGSGAHFAPTGRLLASHKGWRNNEAIDEEEYRRQYLAEMRLSYRIFRRSWDWALSQRQIALACYCPAETFCHRYLLAEMLHKVGNAQFIHTERGGEIARPRQLPLFELAPATPVGTAYE